MRHAFCAAPSALSAEAWEAGDPEADAAAEGGDDAEGDSSAEVAEEALAERTDAEAEDAATASATASEPDDGEVSEDDVAEAKPTAPVEPVRNLEHQGAPAASQAPAGERKAS